MRRPPTARPGGTPGDGASRVPLVDVVPPGLVALALVVALVDRQLLVDAGPALLAVAVVAALPHGALDHLVPLGWPARSVREAGVVPLAAVTAGYAAVAVVALLVLLAAPVLGVVLLALAALHLGAGEVSAAALRRRRRPGAARALATTLGVGGVLVAAPAALHPSVADPVLQAVSPGLPGLLPGSVRLAVLLVALAAACAGALLAHREGDDRAAAETGALVTLTLVVPPFAAFAVFLGAWHAPRHTVRLLGDLRAATSDRPRAARRLLAAAAPTTAVAAAALVGLAALAAGGAVSAAVAGLLAITVPHAVVVGALDVRDWRTLPSG